MRWHLLKTFDTIYTIDLHGNAKKKETAPDGSADQNVFDIMQGVSINFFVKTGKKKENELGKGMHFDLFGKRNLKYQFLTEQSLKTTEFTELTPESPNYFFIPKNNEGMETYEEGFAINDLFAKNVTGIVTMGDSFIVDEDLSALKSRLQYFLNETVTEEQLNQKFGLGKNYAKWILENKPSIHIDESKFIPFAYRPFDTRWTYFDNKLLWRWRFDINQHFIASENIALCFCRQFKTGNNYQHAFISHEIIESSFISNRTSEINSAFPLYLKCSSLSSNADITRIPNLNPEILTQIADGMGLTFTPEPDAAPDTFAPIDLLDYIYGVLHSPRYRETYKEFLKIDFPRVPYPTDAAVFRRWRDAGAQLRGLHLLEDASLNTPITTYPIAGDHVVGKPRFELDDGDTENEGLGRVWINATQYVGNVPQVAWDFYIGGYQPAQKWLKDRKDRALNFDDLIHYQKIINAQFQTHALMQTLTDLAWD
jgi:predicted helicase